MNVLISLTAVASLMSATAHAQSNGGAVVERANAQVSQLTRPAPEGDGKTPWAAHTPQSISRFLNSVRNLATQPPIAVEKITAEFGWSVWKELHADDKSYTHTFFDVYPDKPWINPMFTEHRTRGEISFRMQLDKPRICLRSADVLDVFGSSFKKNVAVMIHPYPKREELSDAVKNDFNLFAYGPIYTFNHPRTTTLLYFNFILSACAGSLSIVTTNLSGAQQ